MNLLQLEYFSVIARTENMSKAAEELHVSQPTLSQVLSRLEKELNTTLFDRQGKKLVLNDTGKYLLERTNFILSYISETVDTIKNRSSQDNEITLYIHTGHLLFKKIIETFTKRYPYACFHINHDSRHQPDYINIGYGNSIANTVRQCYLLDDEILLLVSAKSDLSRRTTINVSELKDMNFINNESDFLKELSQPFCEKAGFTPKFTYKVRNNSEMQDLIRANYGIAFWPKSVLSEITNKNICTVKLQKPLCIRSITLTLPESRKLSALEQDFVNYCQKYFATEE